MDYALIGKTIQEKIPAKSHSGKNRIKSKYKNENAAYEQKNH